MEGGKTPIADRWVRQTNFDVEIIYGIGVERRRRLDGISRRVPRRIVWEQDDSL